MGRIQWRRSFLRACSKGEQRNGMVAGRTRGDFSQILQHICVLVGMTQQRGKIYDARKKENPRVTAGKVSLGRLAGMESVGKQGIWQESLSLCSVYAARWPPRHDVFRRVLDFSPQHHSELPEECCNSTLGRNTHYFLRPITMN